MLTPEQTIAQVEPAARADQLPVAGAGALPDCRSSCGVLAGDIDSEEWST